MQRIQVEYDKQEKAEEKRGTAGKHGARTTKLDALEVCATAALEYSEVIRRKSEDFST